MLEPSLYRRMHTVLDVSCRVRLSIGMLLLENSYLLLQLQLLLLIMTITEAVPPDHYNGYHCSTFTLCLK